MNNELTEKVLDVAGDMAAVASRSLPGPIQFAFLGLGGILKAAALALRDQGKSVDEVIRDIKRPRSLDTSWRDEIDRRIAEKPEGEG